MSSLARFLNIYSDFQPANIIKFELREMHRKILFSLLAMTSALKAGTSAFEEVRFAEHELADFEPELLQSEEELAVYNGKEVFEAEAWLNEEIILNEEDTLSFKADEENSSEHPSL